MLNFQHNGPNSYGAWYRDTWYVVEKADDGDWIFASMPRHGQSLQVISRHIGKSEAMGAAHAQSTADSRRKSARSKASRSKPKRSYASRRKSTARKSGRRKTLGRVHKTRTRLRRTRLAVGRRKYVSARKKDLLKRVRSAVLDRYNAGRHDEALEVLKHNADEIGLSTEKLNRMPTTEAVDLGLRTIAVYPDKPSF